MNTWGNTVEPTALPLGDGKVSTTPKVGYVDSCTTEFSGEFRAGGAPHSGDWIDVGTWNMDTKVAVLV